MDRHQGCGAGGLHRDARPLQVKEVGGSGREEVLVVARMTQEEEPHLFEELGIGEQVVGEIGLHAAARENADGSRERLGTMACILQRLPGTFEEMAVLGVENGRLPRAQAEKSRIERFHVGQDHSGLHVARVAQMRG